MGALAESIMTYAQPLLDELGGSPEGMQKALAMAQVCWNLAILPEDEREELLAELRTSFPMNDSEFEDFRKAVILPMIRRHHEMFPHMRQQGSMNHSNEPAAPQIQPVVSLRTGKYPGTARNAPCPCNSGRKYKRCCGR